jgi:hypothetical protein
MVVLVVGGFSKQFKMATIEIFPGNDYSTKTSIPRGHQAL